MQGCLACMLLDGLTCARIAVCDIQLSVVAKLVKELCDMEGGGWLYDCMFFVLAARLRVPT